jgi:type I restriction enzyme S subunit
VSAWTAVPLADIVESIDYGVTASAAERPVGPKFLRITDIQDGSVDWDRVPWCECGEHEARDSRLAPGDIVFARTGATTGKSFLVGDCPTDAVFASYLIRVRVGADVEPRYLSQFFQTPNYWAQITKGARGAAQPGVNATTLKGLKVPFPPLPEQRRIADVLDRAEALRAKRRAALAQLDALTQSIFRDLFGDPTTNPKGWRVVALGDVAATTSGGTPNRAVSEYFGGGIPWVKSGELHQGVVTETEETLSQRGLAESSAKRMPRGTVLVAMYGATVGAVAILGIEASTNQAVCCIQPSNELHADYLVHLLRRLSPALLAKRVGGAQPNLSQDLIRKLLVPLPPRGLQMDFFFRIEAVARLRAQHRMSLASFDALFASVQHRAFAGEL